MVRILFPGVGILVLSAWCLGILNSHRHFFLPYAAPVLWNLAMIGALLGFGGSIQSYPLAEIVAWGSVAGSVLQFGVQLPSVLRLAGRMRFQVEIVSSNIRTVIRNFMPGVAGRGVNQVSSYIDAILCQFPAHRGAVAALAYVADDLSSARQPLRHVHFERRIARDGEPDRIGGCRCRQLSASA